MDGCVILWTRVAEAIISGDLADRDNVDFICARERGSEFCASAWTGLACSLACLLCFLHPPSLTTPSLSYSNTIPATASDTSPRNRPRDLHVPADRMVSELYVASASGDLDKVSALLEGGNVDLEIKGVYGICDC